MLRETAFDRLIIIDYCKTLYKSKKCLDKITKRQGITK